MTYAISPAGVALIKDGEGFRAAPTQLPDGDWVVGYGHVRTGEAGEAVSESEAEALLKADLVQFERLVNAHVTARLTQSQFDALVSFAFSIGPDAFASSQVLRRVNNAEHVAAACAMDAWRKADVDGALEIVDALVRRRAEEKALYLKDAALPTAPSVFMRAKLDYAASVLGAPVSTAAAPAVETARVAAPKPEPVARLVEILKSEPATETLLLTQVAPAEDDEPVEEIVTAHAKPIARNVDIELLPSMRDRRLAKLRASNARESFWDKFDISHTFETLGLVALVIFGVALLGLAAALVMTDVLDMIQIGGAILLAAPGLASVGLGGWALLRGGKTPAHA